MSLIRNMLCYCLWTMLLFGCAGLPRPQAQATQKSGLMRDYLTRVHRADGIDPAEAVILAKSQFYFQGLEHRYDLNHFQLRDANAAYWAVRFEKRRKTLREVLEGPAAILFIDKDDGSVHWREYYAKE